MRVVSRHNSWQQRVQSVRDGMCFVSVVADSNAYRIAKPEYRFARGPARVQIAIVRPFLTRQRYAFLFLALLFVGFFAVFFAVFFTFLFAGFFAGFRSGL
jgi:hypothetical protein